MPVVALATAAAVLLVVLVRSVRAHRSPRLADPKDVALVSLASLVGRARSVDAPPVREVPAPGRPSVTILGDARPRPLPAPHRRAS